jgi:hypothetical protein
MLQCAGNPLEAHDIKSVSYEIGVQFAVSLTDAPENNWLSGQESRMEQNKAVSEASPAAPCPIRGGRVDYSKAFNLGDGYNNNG